MKERIFTEDFINDFVEGLNPISENFDSRRIDVNDDYYLSLDHGHAIVKFDLVGWDDNRNTWIDVVSVKVALTGDFMDDIKYGVGMALRSAKK